MAIDKLDKLDPTASAERPILFGIGMQRTGTSSLAAAARILGWSACHGDYTRFPGALNLHDPIYKRFNMFCDTPFYAIFEKLDNRFPSAKFILTTRDENSWLKSVRRLFEVNGQFKSIATARMHHTIIYGSANFDESCARAVFAEHHRRVTSYFASRPQKLLIIDLSVAMSWDPLCKFLQCPKPLRDFPHLNKIDPPIK